MEYHRKHGARELPGDSLWSQYKAWLSGLDRGQKLRYRCLQTAVILSLVVIVGYAALSAWVRVPTVPNDIRGEQQGEVDSSGNLTFDGVEDPVTSTGNGRKDGVYTFLVAGRDVISGSTDTMLLVTYDTVNKKIYGLNLPRDTMVNVSTASKRLNAVYTYNRGKDKATQTEKGMAALKEQVAKLTGIAPDFYVVVEWKAIGELVDAIGGVEFEVPFLMDYKDPEQDLVIYQEPGLRLLDGDDAMQVIRHRKNSDGSHSNGDVGRLKVQQDFLKAVAKKCLQPAILLKAPSLAKIFMENVKTDLTVGNLLAFAQLAYGMDAESGVNFETAPLAANFSYRGASLVTLDGEELLKIVNAEMNPYLREIELDDLELLYRKKDGSFGVTRGTLADSAMAKPYTPPASKPKDDPEEEEIIDPEDPEAGGELPGTTPGGTTPGGTTPGGTTPGGTTPGGTTPGGTTPGGTTPGGTTPGGTAPSGETVPPGEGEPTPGDEPQTQPGSPEPSGSGIPTGEIDPGEIFPDPQGPEPVEPETPAGVLPSQPDPVEPVQAGTE